jgi:hypothetical protein
MHALVETRVYSFSTVYLGVFQLIDSNPPIQANSRTATIKDRAELSFFWEIIAVDL